MYLIKNLLIFFLVFLPLTYIVGIPGALYHGRFESAVTNSQIYNWGLVGLTLVLPCILFIPVLHLIVRYYPGLVRAIGGARIFSTIVFPIGFLFTHLLVWGTDLLSWQLLTIILIPGLLFGLLARMPSLAKSTD